MQHSVLYPIYIFLNLQPQHDQREYMDKNLRRSRVYIYRAWHQQQYQSISLSAETLMVIIKEEYVLDDPRLLLQLRQMHAHEKDNVIIGVQRASIMFRPRNLNWTQQRYLLHKQTEISIYTCWARWTKFLCMGVFITSTISCFPSTCVSRSFTQLPMLSDYRI